MTTHDPTAMALMGASHFGENPDEPVTDEMREAYDFVGEAEVATKAIRAHLRLSRSQIAVPLRALERKGAFKRCWDQGQTFWRRAAPLAPCALSAPSLGPGAGADEVDEIGRPFCGLCAGHGGWYGEGDPSDDTWIVCEDCHGTGLRASRAAR